MLIGSNPVRNRYFHTGHTGIIVQINGIRTLVFTLFLEASHDDTGVGIHIFHPRIDISLQTGTHSGYPPIGTRYGICTVGQYLTE